MVIFGRQEQSAEDLISYGKWFAIYDNLESSIYSKSPFISTIP
jgi:hypothetical protein